MVVDATLSAWRTIARILASFVDARQIECALNMRRALGSFACDQRIAAISVQAIAPGVMIVLGSADGIRAALDLLARFDAIAIDARLTWRTVVIGATSN